MSEPHRIYGWLDSQLSIARFYGEITINGKTYRIRYDLEGQPLEELQTKRKAKREKRDEAIDLFVQEKMRKEEKV
jgi:hypothetical protein